MTDSAVRDVSEAAVDAPPRVVRAWWTLSGLRGAVAVDGTFRLRSRGSEGSRVLLPGEPEAPRRAARDGDGLLPGDLLSTGLESAVEVSLEGGGALRAGASGALEVPGHAGAHAVHTLGGVELVSLAGEAVRVDTPAGRVLVSTGRAWVCVALDGSTAVRAETAGVTLWATPAPPAARATRLTPAARARLRAQAQHPVLLDVDLPELAAREVRPVAPVALAPGESRVFTPLGLPGSGAGPGASQALLSRWCANRSAAVGRPEAHLYAISELSRAGSGDLADARTALARLRTGGGAPEARQALLAQLSLALGRGTARARRGRSLALRGGDVTALAQLASLEALRDEALRDAPVEAPTTP
ncbi:MAG: hypothetical protein HY909_19080 [Deltaproteobacteria bacterium]|nr:hypothetical protein [Deltaproteobacteria bacterium]